MALGRNLRLLVNAVDDLNACGIGLRVMSGTEPRSTPTTAAGKLVIGIFAALAEFERELIRGRTIAGLAAARASRRSFNVGLVKGEGCGEPTTALISPAAQVVRPWITNCPTRTATAGAHDRYDLIVKLMPVLEF
jgi:DNA invertase Pin-like site-specific DNA recombinase